MEIPLVQLRRGKIAIVKKLNGCPDMENQICSLGLRVGKKIKVMSLYPFKGPVVVETEGMQIAIGRGVAQKIIVEVEA